MSQPLYKGYKFRTRTSAKELVESINSLLADGYVPCGGIQVVRSGDDWCYIQAVAKPISPTSQLQQELKEQ